jgi:hypothetical protein
VFRILFALGCSPLANRTGLTVAAWAVSLAYKALKLKSGSAEKHIEEAAKRWGYVAVRKGRGTILFEDGPAQSGGRNWMSY